MFQSFLRSVRDLVVGPHLDERRGIPRVICRIPVQCHCSGLDLEGRIRDLSSEGAQLKLFEKVSKGEILRLRPEATDVESISGEVAWVRRQHSHHLVGIKFESFPEGTWLEAFFRELGILDVAPQQRREHVRFPTSLKIHCQHQDQAFAAVLKDLSLGGLFLESDQAIGEGESFEVNLPKFSGAPSLLLDAQCKTCKLNEDDGKHQISAKFGKIDSKQKKKLLQHLKVLLKLSLSS